MAISFDPVLEFPKVIIATRGFYLYLSSPETMELLKKKPSVHGLKGRTALCSIFFLARFERAFIKKSVGPLAR